MKNFIKCILISAIFLTIESCTVSKYSVVPYGDLAKVELKKGNKFEARIVYLTDTSIVFMNDSQLLSYNMFHQNRLFYVLKNEIHSININGYNNQNWILHVALFQALPSVLIIIAATSEMGFDENLLIFTLPALFTTISFLASEEKTPGWNDSKNISTMDSLKIYSSYPTKLAENKIEILTSKFGQKIIRRYGGGEK